MSYSMFFRLSCFPRPQLFPQIKFPTRRPVTPSRLSGLVVSSSPSLGLRHTCSAGRLFTLVPGGREMFRPPQHPRVRQHLLAHLRCESRGSATTPRNFNVVYLPGTECSPSFVVSSVPPTWKSSRGYFSRFFCDAYMGTTFLEHPPNLQ